MALVLAWTGEVLFRILVFTAAKLNVVLSFLFFLLGRRVITLLVISGSRAVQILKMALSQVVRELLLFDISDSVDVLELPLPIPVLVE